MGFTKKLVEELTEARHHYDMGMAARQEESILLGEPPIVPINAADSLKHRIVAIHKSYCKKNGIA